MGLSKFRIGQLVEQTTEINTDYLFGADDVRGMTLTKQIIPTKADVSVADLSKFLVIHPKEFVFNPRTHGKHIGFKRTVKSTNQGYLPDFNSWLT